MLDDLDRKLLGLLARDGRQAHTSLAESLGVSAGTIKTRMDKLQNDEVLRIVALCNPLTLGHQSLRLMITVRDLTPRAVARLLKELTMINHVALCAGAQDIYLEATCKDTEQLVDLLDEIRAMPGIARIEALVLLELFKDYSWTGLSTSTGQEPTEE